MDLGSAENVIDKDRDCENTHRRRISLIPTLQISPLPVRLTLHPTLPFVRLFTIQKTHILVPFHGRQTANHQPAKHQDRKRPGTVRFLFLKEDRCSIRNEHVCDSDAERSKSEGY